MRLEEALLEYRKMGMSYRCYLIQNNRLRKIKIEDFQLPVILEFEIRCGNAHRILYFQEDIDIFPKDDVIEQMSLFT